MSMGPVGLREAYGHLAHEKSVQNQPDAML